MFTRQFLFDPAAVAGQFASCHAATVAETSPGRFLAAWFGGTREGAADVSIWLASRSNGLWTSPQRVARVCDAAHWNPVLFCDGGRTHLFFKVGMHIESWQTWVMHSDDGGACWSLPRQLVAGDCGGRGPVKNKPIRLSNGDWLAPASLESGGNWTAFVDRSRDAGRSWQAGPQLQADADRLSAGRCHADSRGAGVIQPTLWESAPGRIHMLLRSTFGRICRSDSDDNGHTWGPVVTTDLPNNNSAIDLAGLPDGRLVLACNPVEGNWGPRTPLSAFCSSDNGESWIRLADLEDEPVRGQERPRPEFSYPSVIACSQGVAVVYTWKRRTIAFSIARSPFGTG